MMGGVSDWEASYQIESAWRKRLWDLAHPWESPYRVRCRKRTTQAIAKHAECHVVPSGGWLEVEVEPPPAPTSVMEVRKDLEVRGQFLCFLWCAPRCIEPQLVHGEVHHRLCGFMIVITRLVLVAWVGWPLA